MYHYILRELSKVFCTNQKAYFNIFFDKQIILMINKTEFNSQNINCQSFKLSDKTFKFGDNVRNFSTFYCNRNNEVNSLVKLKPERKLKPKSLEKILINGLIFNKSEDEL